MTTLFSYLRYSVSSMLMTKPFCFFIVMKIDEKWGKATEEICFGVQLKIVLLFELSHVQCEFEQRVNTMQRSCVRYL